MKIFLLSLTSQRLLISMLFQPEESFFQGLNTPSTSHLSHATLVSLRISQWTLNSLEASTKSPSSFKAHAARLPERMNLPEAQLLKRMTSLPLRLLLMNTKPILTQAKRPSRKPKVLVPQISLSGLATAQPWVWIQTLKLITLRRLIRSL